MVFKSYHDGWHSTPIVTLGSGLLYAAALPRGHPRYYYEHDLQTWEIRWLTGRARKLPLILKP